TAKRPGETTIVATLPNLNSLPTQATTCFPDAIQLVVQSTLATSVTLATAGTSQLAVAVTDSNGTVILDPGLTYSSTNPSVASVSVSRLVTAGVPGTASIVASCTPPTCG